MRGRERRVRGVIERSERKRKWGGERVYGYWIFAYGVPDMDHRLAS